MITKRLGVEHLGYRVMAALIALVLWVAVMSQREMQVRQKTQVRFAVPADYWIEGQSEFTVTVALEGPRVSLRKFLDHSWPSVIVIPVRHPSVGSMRFRISSSDFQIPAGIKVHSLQPPEVLLEIKQKAD